MVIDVKRYSNGFYVYINGGRIDIGFDVVKWVKEVEMRGVGEILFILMDRDGIKVGYDLEFLEVVCSSVNIFVIVLGGVGRLEYFLEVFKVGVEAVLAVFIFYFGEILIGDLKSYLKNYGIEVRI